jgi:hypothetical protein
MNTRNWIAGIKPIVRNILLVVIAFECLTACKSHSGGQVQPEMIITFDEYDIYSARILYRLKQGSRTKMLVIRVEADSDNTGHCFPEAILDSRIGLSKDELDSLVKDFKVRNITEGKITKALNVPLSQEFISDAEMRSIFTGTERYSGWKNFYKKFPDAIGYESFTRAGFNAERTKALIHSCLIGENTMGLGSYTILSKENGKWEIIGEVSCGIS